MSTAKIGKKCQIHRSNTKYCCISTQRHVDVYALDGKFAKRFSQSRLNFPPKTIWCGVNQRGKSILQAIQNLSH
ncbi:MAG: hypothetical protein ABIE74_06975 [Pseudomonadota bacterium]